MTTTHGNTLRTHQIFGTLLLTLVSSTTLPAQPIPGAGVLVHEIEIEFENARGPEIPIEPPSGWPLTLSLTANDGLLFGLGTASGVREWPYETQPPNLRGRPGDNITETGFLVFRDPYEPPSDPATWCHSWLNRFYLEEHMKTLEGWDPDGGTEPPVLKHCPKEDSWVEFTPGRRDGSLSEACELPALSMFERQPDLVRPEEELEELAEEFSIPLESLRGTLGTNTKRIPFGVCGGSNPRLPSLVLLADQGQGVVLDSKLQPRAPRELRNLAALIDSVAYELKDSLGRTRILAQMTVDGALFSPAVLYDNLVSCSDSSNHCQGFEERFIPYNSRSLVTLRAFIVQGRAPDALADANGDGQVDLWDAQALGFQLLSDEALFSFIQLQDERLAPFRIPVDLDGNGLAVDGAVDPPSPGRLTPPPD